MVPTTGYPEPVPPRSSSYDLVLCRSPTTARPCDTDDVHTFVSFSRTYLVLLVTTVQILHPYSLTILSSPPPCILSFLIRVVRRDDTGESVLVEALFVVGPGAAGADALVATLAYIRSSGAASVAAVAYVPAGVAGRGSVATSRLVGLVSTGWGGVWVLVPLLPVACVEPYLVFGTSNISSSITMPRNQLTAVKGYSISPGGSSPVMAL